MSFVSTLGPTGFVLSSGVVLALGFVAWFVVEKRRRRTHPVPPGHQGDLEFPHEQPFELYHNALSLCSMKTRVCLAELEIPYRSHHIDLIETGCYENIRPRLLRVNPGGTVPVLLHHGHPIYESHEQIRYAARHAPAGVPSLVPEDPGLRTEMETWIDRSSLTANPIENGDKSAGNAIPGLTVPLFCTMIERIPVWRIGEGLLFHFDKFRPFLFLVLKLRGIHNLPKLRPAATAIGRSRKQLGTHLDALEAKLAETGGPWILGEAFSLADVSWLVLFERLRQADAEGAFLGGSAGSEKRPLCTAYWERLRARPSYTTAILGHSHPLIDYGRNRIAEAKAADPTLRVCLDGA
jgi:glutathione S-transferase